MSYAFSGAGIRPETDSADRRSAYQRSIAAVSYTHLDVYKRQVHDELDVMAVQFQELGLDQLCWVIVPGHPDGLEMCIRDRDGSIHIVVEVAQVFKDGGPRFRLGQQIGRASCRERV